MPFPHELFTLYNPVHDKIEIGHISPAIARIKVSRVHLTSCASSGGNSDVPVNVNERGSVCFLESLPALVFPQQRRSLGLRAGDSEVDVAQGDGLHVAWWKTQR